MGITNNNYIVALYNTIIIIVSVIIIGKIIDFISMTLLKITSKRIGVKATLIFANYITFIGTVHHEIAHAIFAFITGAKVTSITLFKPKDGTLGCVKYIPRGNSVIVSIQNTMSAIAPVILGFTSEYLLYLSLGYATDIWLKILIIYTMISIFIHMNLSNQDIKMAMKGLPICSMLLYIIVLLLKFNIFNLI